MGNQHTVKFVSRQSSAWPEHIKRTQKKLLRTRQEKIQRRLDKILKKAII